MYTYVLYACIHMYILHGITGISGYRDDSLETVKRNQLQYKLPLTILSYRDLYGYKALLSCL